MAGTEAAAAAHLAEEEFAQPDGQARSKSSKKKQCWPEGGAREPGRSYGAS